MSSQATSRFTKRMTALVVLLTIATGIGLYLEHGKTKQRPPASSTTLQPDVIYIVVSGMRAGTLSCYGSSDMQSEEIDRFAAQSVLFENCFTPSPNTRPACLSIVSGASPLVHGIHDDAQDQVTAADYITLQGTLKNKGYATAAFVSDPCLRDFSLLAEDFDRYDDKLQADGSSRDARDTLSAALHWLYGIERNRPACLVIQLADLEAPFWPPNAEAQGLEASEDFFIDEIIDLYQGEVRYVDNELGKFFGRLKQAKRYQHAMIALAADHGQGLGYGDEMLSGALPFDGTTHVPMIVKWPSNQYAGQRVTTLVQTTDLTPSVLGALGIEQPAPAADLPEGRDLEVLLESHDQPIQWRDAYIESYQPYMQAGLGKVRALRRTKDLIVFSAGKSAYYNVDYAEATLGPNLLEARHSSSQEIEDLVREARVEVMRYLDAAQALPRHAPFALETPNFEFDLQLLASEALSKSDHLSDDRTRVSPLEVADPIRQFQRAQLILAHGDVFDARNALALVIAESANFLPALILHAVAERALANEEGLTQENAATFHQSAATYLARATIAAENAGMKHLAQALYAHQLYDELHAANERSSIEEIHDLSAARLEKNADTMTTQTRLHYVWLRHISAYLLNERDDKRIQVGVMFERELGEYANLLRPLINRMKRGQADVGTADGGMFHR